MNRRYLRIHGDNIMECEKTLLLLSRAFDREVRLMPESSLYMPVYKLSVNTKETLQIDLIAGHGRCGVDMAIVLMNYGGIVCENSNSYITEVVRGKEQVLLTVEYSSTLSAGNSAWQRSGRAYSSVMAGIPYLSYVEIGGVELDENGTVKMSRFPNPVVPLSYLNLTQRMNAFCLPVYTAHPSITDTLNEKIKGVFGYSDSLEFVKGFVLKTGFVKAVVETVKKTLLFISLSTNESGTTDKLQKDEWSGWVNAKSSGEWLKKLTVHSIWNKKAMDRVRLSKTLKQLFSSVLALGCLSVGAKDLPICLIPNNKITDFERLLKQFYPAEEITFDKNKQLAIVWVAGFKPRGDESQPDRGLTPLARMILGNDTDILTVVYGPIKQSTWKAFIDSPEQIAMDSVLWQSILNTCDYLLIDSVTCDEQLFCTVDVNKRENFAPVSFSYRRQYVAFSEQDTASAIHQIFSRKEKFGVYESLCNPPGSECPGISYFESGGNEYRWTSLPRGSAAGGKRPGHIIQITGETENVFLSIESKQNGIDLEKNSGVNLKTYINDLFRTLPAACKTATRDWRFFDGDRLNIRQYSVISIGAFIYSDEDEDDLQTQLQRGKLDAVFAFEFGGKETVLHVLSNTDGDFVKDLLKRICSGVKGIKIWW